eukprot:scaffold16903_cov31-Tisochrysis_lutea.AAC.2
MKELGTEAPLRGLRAGARRTAPPRCGAAAIPRGWSIRVAPIVRPASSSDASSSSNCSGCDTQYK